MRSSKTDARRRGRRFGVHYSRAVPGARVEIEVRVDYKGVFSAEYLGVWHSAESHAALIVKLDNAVRSNSALTWDYFIEIDDVEFEDTEHSIHHGRFGRQPKVRLEVDYAVVKVSSVVKNENSLQRAYRLTKQAFVNDAGELVDDKDDPDMEYDEGHRLRIPYTVERWRKLEQITAAARELGMRLQGVLNRGGGTAVAGFLDRASSDPLALPAVAAPTRRKR